MSHKEPMFYRAPNHAGAPNEWEEDHFIRLGALAAFQAQLANELEALAWNEPSQDNIAVGEGLHNGIPVFVMAHLDPASGEVIWFGLANCLEASLVERLKKRFAAQAFDFECRECM